MDLRRLALLVLLALASIPLVARASPGAPMATFSLVAPVCDMATYQSPQNSVPLSSSVCGLALWGTIYQAGPSSELERTGTLTFDLHYRAFGNMTAPVWDSWFGVKTDRYWQPDACMQQARFNAVPWTSSCDTIIEVGSNWGPPFTCVSVGDGVLGEEPAFSFGAALHQAWHVSYAGDEPSYTPFNGEC